jgi:succinoglycan biosynthesis transport protein ExoP
MISRGAATTDPAASAASLWRFTMVDDNLTPNRRAPQTVAIVRRRLWIVILCTVVAAGAAFLVSRTQQKKYTATSALLFQTSQFSQQLFGFTASAASIDPTTQQATNVALVSEPVVAVKTAQTLGHGVTGTRVTDSVTVAAAGASSVVSVSATDPSPIVAAKLANAYANEFIAYETHASVAQVEQAAAQLQSQITRVAATSPKSSQLTALETRLSQLQALASLQTGNVQLAEEAFPPSTPSSPRVAREVALGVLAGLVIGLLAAFVAERLDQTLRDPEEVKSLLGLPVLGAIPSSRSLLGRSKGARPLGATSEAEAFRLLRAQLRYFNVDRRIQSVLVTSAAPGDGKSTVAWNLASSAAIVSPTSSVLLVDADLRRPRIASLSDEPSSPGLSELLTHGLHFDEVIRLKHLGDAGPADASPALSIITAGALPPNPSELMESHKLHLLLEELHQHYDLIVVDAPPPSIVSDAIPLMRQVSGVLVVVRLRQTRRSAVRALREQLDRLAAPCLGLILNDVPSGDSRYKGYKRYGGAYSAPLPPGPGDVVHVDSAADAAVSS